MIQFFLRGILFFAFLFESSWAVEDHLFASYEKAYDLPCNLLRSIAYTESGYKTQSNTVAWPWTIHAEGRGFYCPDKKTALRLAESFYQKGIHNIDVGCMQINLKHHPKAFPNLSAALDPEFNIDYAARYLKQLYQHHQSWSKAVAYYHSKTPFHYQKYLQKVNQIQQSLAASLPHDSKQKLVRFEDYEENSPPLFRVVPFSGKSKNTFIKTFAKARSYRQSLHRPPPK